MLRHGLEEEPQLGLFLGSHAALVGRGRPPSRAGSFTLEPVCGVIGFRRVEGGQRLGGRQRIHEHDAARRAPGHERGMRRRSVGPVPYDVEVLQGEAFAGRARQKLPGRAIANVEKTELVLHLLRGKLGTLRPCPCSYAGSLLGLKRGTDDGTDE